MRCPLCDVAMREVSRRGVKIDVCPECRGVWLDRGELDHLIEAEPEYAEAAPERRREPERAASGEPRSEQRAASRRRDDDDDDDDRERDRERFRGDERGYAAPRKKRSSWLSEIFELGGGGD